MRWVAAVAVLGLADPVCTSRESSFAEGSSSAVGASSSSSGAGQCPSGDAEPNGERALAVNLGEFGSDLEPMTISAAVGLGDTEDWFTLNGTVVEDHEARLVFDVVPDQSGLELCLYVLCHNPPNEGVACMEGDPEVVNELEGCCRTDGAPQVRHSCRMSPAGISDHAQLWYQVRAPNAAACFEYTLWYGF